MSAEPGRRSSGAAAGRVRDIPLATATADRASTIGPSTAKYRVHRPAALSLAGCSGRRVRRHVADIRDPTLTSRLGAGSSEHRPSRAGHVPVSGRRQRRASDAFEDWRSPRARRHRHCGVASAPGRAVDSQLRPRRLVHRESALRRSGWERGIDGSPCPGSGRAATSGRLAAGMACLQRVVHGRSPGRHGCLVVGGMQASASGAECIGRRLLQRASRASLDPPWVGGSREAPEQLLRGERIELSSPADR